ncbi:MAG: hypothetical protein HY716_18935 [Planctomycetes bacterium]|nr:hypothetical protein [Planctomycetota bacterium]
MEIETDVDTFLAGEADRLRVVAFALRGSLANTGEASIEPMVLHSWAVLAFDDLNAGAAGGLFRIHASPDLCP